MLKYDVAVMGAGLGGLAAAALLSCKNKRTIVIEQGTSSDACGVVEKDGFIFSLGPALSYGFERGGALQELAAVLGIEHKVSVPSPCYQVALPDHRITVYANPAETLEELRREFRSEIDAIAQFYGDLDTLAKKREKSSLSAYLLRHRSAAGVLRKYGFSRELMTFLDVQSLFFFQKPAVYLPLASLVTLCCTPPFRLDDGFRKFGDQLYRVILQHGGEVRYNESSPALAFRDHGSVEIETGQGMVKADTILLNMLPRQHKSMLLVGVLEEVIPQGMSSDVLFLPEYSRPQDFMALSLDPQGNDSIGLEGTKALTVSFASSQSAPEDKPVRLEQLGRLIPFLNDFMFFAEEYMPGAGHAVFPPHNAMKPLRPQEGSSLFYRTAAKNVFVLRDTPETPLQAVETVQRNIAKLN
jgi:phytoene dehydrogenase-like protein